MQLYIHLIVSPLYDIVIIIFDFERKDGGLCLEPPAYFWYIRNIKYNFEPLGHLKREGGGEKPLYGIVFSEDWQRSMLFLCSEYSMQLNASRIRVLQAQDDLVNSMKEAAAKELLHVSDDHHAYKNLLKELIVQVNT